MSRSAEVPSTSLPAGERVEFRVRGLDCADEVALLRRALEPLAGVQELGFDLLQQRLLVRYDAGRVEPRALAAAIAQTGLHAEPWAESAEPARVPPAWPLLLGGAALLAGMLVHLLSGASLAHALAGADPPLVSRLLDLLAVLACGLPLLPRAFAAARSLRPDMHLLMAVAIAGALALGDVLEAGTVAFLFALSLRLEGWSAARARRAVAGLLELQPGEVSVLGDGGERRLPAGEVPVGSRVLLRPGDRVSLDARVLSGRSALDESLLTGEPLPVEKGPGDPILAGSINGSGALEAETTAEAADSSAARVARLISEARGRRSRSERLIERFARIYTPVVLLAAAGAVLVPPLLLGHTWADSFYQAAALARSCSPRRSRWPARWPAPRGKACW
jgi:Cd2+/Zn2+-exporting ATPase